MAKKKIQESDLDFLNINEDNVLKSPFEDVIGERFGAYSKYIIQDRALPDLRDGLKPVQRRILFGMKEAGMLPTSEYKKSARIVGDVMGKYHPHGDSSIYDAMIRMSQWWKNSVTFIDVHGNNGSMDDDPPAAMRYTEARLSPIAMEMLRDIEKDTVEMALNFDDSLLEPTVLPAKFPALLVNGAKGIAAGFATDIPPHNLSEVIDATIARIKSPSCHLETILNIITGPDFPTGGIIMGKKGIQEAYQTGKGKIILRSKVEEKVVDKQRQLIITEIPYEVIKQDLVKRIDEIRFNKEIWGIEEIRDETDRKGLRIVIDISENANSELILNYLYKQSNLQISYNFNMVTIDNKTPRLAGILDILDSYIAHQKDVILRRSKFDYNKCADKLHIDEGLIKAVSIIDKVIATIRKSTSKANSKENLINGFGFSEKQAEAIVTLQLYRLSSTDISTLENEINSLKDQMNELNKILTDENELKKVMINELKDIKNKYGYPRKTVIEDEYQEIVIDKKATVIKEDVMVAITRDGYGKRTSLKSYNTANSVFPGFKQQDAVVAIGKLTTLDTLLCFTSGGSYLYIPVFELAENKWKDEGDHINKIASYPGNDKIVSVIAVNEFRDDLYIALVTLQGQIKRVPLNEFKTNRYSKGLICAKIEKDDKLVSAMLCNGGKDIAVLYSTGNIVRYDENQVSILGLKASGVKAGSRNIKGNVVGAITLSNDFKGSMMLATNKGGLKPVYPRYINKTSRNTMGTLAFKCFKSDAHEAVGLITYKENDIIQLVSNFKSINIETSKVPYQPIDKIITKQVDLDKMEKIVDIVSSNMDYVDKNTKSFKINNSPIEFASFDDKTNQNDENNDNDKKEKYKNISIEDLFKI